MSVHRETAETIKLQKTAMIEYFQKTHPSLAANSTVIEKIKILEKYTPNRKMLRVGLLALGGSQMRDPRESIK